MFNQHPHPQGRVRVYSGFNQVSGGLTRTRFPFKNSRKHKHSKGVREWRVKPLYSLKLRNQLIKN